MGRRHSFTLVLIILLMFLAPLTPLASSTQGRVESVTADIMWETTPVKLIISDTDGADPDWSGTYERTTYNWEVPLGTTSPATQGGDHRTYIDSTAMLTLAIDAGGDWRLVDTDVTFNPNFSNYCGLGAQGTMQSPGNGTFGISGCNNAVTVSESYDTFLESMIDVDLTTSSSNYLFEWDLSNSCTTSNYVDSGNFSWIGDGGLQPIGLSFPARVSGEYKLFYLLKRDGSLIASSDTGCSGQPPGGDGSSPIVSMITNLFNETRGVVEVHYDLANLVIGTWYDLNFEAAEYDGNVCGSGVTLVYSSSNATSTTLSFEQDFGANYSGYGSNGDVFGELVPGTEYCAIVSLMTDSGTNLDNQTLVFEMTNQGWDGYCDADGDGNDISPADVCWDADFTSSGATFSQEAGSWSGRSVNFEHGATGVSLGRTAISGGKVYFEIEVSGEDYLAHVGVATQSVSQTQAFPGVGGWGYASDSDAVAESWSKSTLGDSWQPGSTPARIGVALDSDAGKLWASVDGAWVNNGDPVQGTIPLFGPGGIWTDSSGSEANLSGLTLHPAVWMETTGASIQFEMHSNSAEFWYPAPTGYTEIDSYGSGGSSSGTGSWTVEQISDDSPQTTTVAIDSNGVAQIAYFDSTTNSLVHTDSSTPGAWSEVNIQTPIFGHVSMTLDSGDDPHIAFSSVSEDLNYMDGGWNVATIDNSVEQASYTSIVLDSNDDPHIAYVDMNSTTLFYAHNDGTGWSIESVDGDTSSVQYETSIALDSAGDPHISYYKLDVGLMYASKLSTTWSIETVDPTGIGDYSSLVLDSLDQPHISYRDGVSFELEYATRVNGGSWELTTVVADSGMNVDAQTSIDLNTDEFPHIVFTDDINSRLGYAAFDGITWSTSYVNSAGGGGSAASLFIDVDDVSHVSYAGNQGIGLYYASSSDPLGGAAGAGAVPLDIVYDWEDWDGDGDGTETPHLSVFYSWNDGTEDVYLMGENQIDLSLTLHDAGVGGNDWVESLSWQTDLSWSAGITDFWAVSTLPSGYWEYRFSVEITNVSTNQVVGSGDYCEYMDTGGSVPDPTIDSQLIWLPADQRLDGSAKYEDLESAIDYFVGWQLYSIDSTNTISYSTSNSVPLFPDADGDGAWTYFWDGGLLPTTNQTVCLYVELQEGTSGGESLDESTTCVYLGVTPANSNEVDWDIDLITDSTASASSQTGGFPASNVIDGDWDTSWMSGDVCLQDITITLNNPTDISAVTLYWADELDQPLHYKLQVDNGIDGFLDVFEIYLEADEWYGEIKHVFPKTYAESVRMQCIDSDFGVVELYQFEIHPWQVDFDPEDGLVGYWPMDESGAVASVADESGMWGDMQFSSGTLAGEPGKFGNGVRFDGGDDKAHPTGTMDWPSDWTVSLWFNQASLSGGDWNLFAWEYLLNGSAQEHRLIIKNANGALQYQAGTMVCLDSTATFTSTDIDEWHHIALSHEIGVGLELYVDGVWLESGSCPGYANGLYDGSQLFIGSAFQNPDSFDGTIDEFRIYDRALDIDEAGALFNNAAQYAGFGAGGPNGGGGPAGTGVDWSVDLSSSANVFATTELDSFSAAQNAIDDDNSTGWRSAGSCPQTITVDLGSEYSLGAIQLLWDSVSDRPTEYEINVWTLADSWQQVLNRIAPAGDGRLGMVEHLLSPVTAEKVQINCLQSSSQIQLEEIGIFAADPNWGGFDQDGDGIGNGADNCWNGVSGWTSDAVLDYDSDGCRDLDEDDDDDNDQIPDADDQCPTGMTDWDSWLDVGADFDHDGCLDSGADNDDDNDNVVDGSDACAQTRLGAMVDVNGCETGFPDGDTDGVADSYDDCPNTPSGVTVDTWDGCPLDPDSDGDGVPDSLDDCGGTPAGTPVTAEGCDDLDLDGVWDASDQCPNTPVGSEVDDTGCDLQPDADGDGVADTDDECPDTVLVSGEEVDDVGCTVTIVPAALEGVLDFLLNIDERFGLPDGTLEIIIGAVSILFAVVRFAGRRTYASKQKRVEKYNREIRLARSRRELEGLEKRITKDNEKNLLPRGGYGDLMELIEMRAIELGEMDMVAEARDRAVAAEVAVSGAAGDDRYGDGYDDEYDDHEGGRASMRDELAHTREAVDALHDELEHMRGGPPGGGGGRGRGPPTRRGADDPGYKMKSYGGPRRPSLHPADIDGDGIVTDEEREEYRKQKEQEDRLWEFD